MTKPNCKFYFIATLLFFLSPNFNLAQQVQRWQSKVSPALLVKLSDHASATFIVVMKQQANLFAAKNIHGKEAKGIYVYNTLSTLARISQQSIISELQNDHASFQSFWVVNALSVNGDEALLKKIAERNDVKRILNNTAMSYAKPVSVEENYERDLTIPWGIDTIHAPAVWQMGIKG